jgi:hypothetical protein
MRAPEPRESSTLGDKMKRTLLGLAVMAIASFGLLAQTNNANAFLLNDRSPNVTAGQIIAGGGMTAAYFLLTCGPGPGGPGFGGPGGPGPGPGIGGPGGGRCARFGSSRSLQWWGLTTIGCFALSPIIGGGLVSYNEHRELRSSEVFMMVGDCVVPILGGLIMKAAFNAHPEWDAGTGRSRR